MQQLETLLSTGEKKVKNMGLSFSNGIFKRAQVGLWLERVGSGGAALQQRV